MREEFLAYSATVQLLWQRRVLINYLSHAVYNLQTAVLFTLLIKALKSPNWRQR